MDKAAEIGAGHNAYDTILGTVGGTPAVRLNKLTASPLDVTVDAKLESFNPTGSVKACIAMSMVEQAEADGQLKVGATIMEATSGNTGIGFAIVPRVEGDRLMFTMSETVSIERRNSQAGP
jgi:cysteine synthase